VGTFSGDNAASRDVATPSTTLLATDFYLDCLTSGGAIDVVLPLAAGFPSGFTFDVIDVDQNAAANNITISPTIPELINLGSVHAITSNGATATVKRNNAGNGWNIAGG
jgi:hypothetical protein